MSCHDSIIGVRAEGSGVYDMSKCYFTGAAGAGSALQDRMSGGCKIQTMKSMPGYLRIESVEMAKIFQQQRNSVASVYTEHLLLGDFMSTDGQT
jgi:hypothetical protein